MNESKVDTIIWMCGLCNDINVSCAYGAELDRTYFCKCNKSSIDSAKGGIIFNGIIEILKLFYDNEYIFYRELDKCFFSQFREIYTSEQLKIIKKIGYELYKETYLQEIKEKANEDINEMKTKLKINNYRVI